MAIKRVLVIQTAFLGDLLLGVPLFKYLKCQFPECEITLVCRKGIGSVLLQLKLVDTVLEVQKKNKDSYREALKKLSHWQFDLLLCPHESLTSAFFSKRVKSRHSIAFHKWWNRLFFKETIVKDKALPEPLRQLSLLQNHDPLLKKQISEFRKVDLDWEKTDSRFLSPVPPWASAAVEPIIDFAEVQTRFQLPGQYVCVFPGSVWATKQWTEQGFKETGQKWASLGVPVLVMGGPGEEGLCDRVAGGIPKAKSLAGRTSLMETLAILKRAQAVVTNDSAGQHLAALVQAPTISVFGPTVLPFGYRPWNSKAIVVERRGLACRPCGKHGHHQCPIGTHECMKGIQASEVWTATQELLDTGGQLQTQSNDT